MLNNTIEKINTTTKNTLGMVDYPMSISTTEEQERYAEYEPDFKPGTEVKFVDNIFFKIDVAIQSGIKSVNKYFLNTSIFIDDMQSYETITPNITDLYRQRSELTDMIKDGALFTAIANKKAPVLAGFDIKLKDGVKIIADNVDLVASLDDYIFEFDAMLDRLISSKKDKIDLRISKNTITNIEAIVDTLNKDISMAINKKVIADRKPVKKLVSNFMELKEVADGLLMHGSTLNMETLDNANSSLTTLITKLDIVQKAIEKDKLKMSKDDFENFVNYIGAMAKYVTAVSFVIYFYLQLVNMTLGVIKIATISSDDKTVLNTISAYITNTFKATGKLFD